MTPNGVGNPNRMRADESYGFDRLPPVVREVIANAPINLGAFGIYEKVRRLRLSDPWEWEAYAKDLREFIDTVMKGSHTSGTRHVWRTDPATRTLNYAEPHPQEAKDYEWPDYQVYPKLTRVTEIEMERIYRKAVDRRSSV